MDGEQDKSINPATASNPFDSKKVVGNIASLGSGEVAARAVAFIGVTYLARALGPEGFGAIGFAVAVCGYFSLAVSAGFNDIGAREVARRPNKASVISFSVTLVRLALASLAMVVLGIVTQFLDKPPTVKLVVVLTGLSLFSLALDTSWVYKGLERNRRVGLVLVLGQILYVGTILLVVKGPKDIMLVPLSQFLGEVSAAVLLAVSIFRTGEINLDLREGLSILRSSGFLTLTRLLRTLIFTFDVVLLGFLLGEKEVGLYTAPYRICLLLLAIANVICVSYLPAMTRALAQGSRQLSDLAGRSVELSSAISVPMVVGGMILATPSLDFVFGPGYVEGGAAFRLLILSVGFIFIYGSIHNVLLVCDRLKVEMWIIAVAAGLNICLNVVLIPLYGLVGAAFATALVEGLILVSGVFAVHRMGVRLNFRPMLRVLLAAGIMANSLIAIGPGHMLVTYVCLGFIVYFLAIVVFRCIPQDVSSFLRHAVTYTKKS